MYRNLKTYIAIFLCSIVSYGNAQEKDRMIKNLSAFGQLAGHLQFFSASDAANYSSWHNLYINGVNTVKNCANDRELLDSLYAIFHMIEPAMFFEYDGKRMYAGPPQDTVGSSKIFKQNRGLDLGSDYTRSFTSIRANRQSKKNFRSDEAQLIDTMIQMPSNIDFYTKLATNQDVEISFTRNGSVLSKQVFSPADSLIQFPVLQQQAGHISLIIQVKQGLELDISEFGLRSASGHPAETASSDSIAEHQYVISISGPDVYLYENHLDFTDSTEIALTELLKVKFPLCLRGDEQQTFPISNRNIFSYDGTEKIEYFSVDGLDYEEVRIANILQIWNVFNFSYAYLDMDMAEREKLLYETLLNALENQNTEDYRKTVWRMLRAYQDGHIFLQFSPSFEEQISYSIPVEVIKIGDSFYIKDIYDSSYHAFLTAGDEIVTINGIATEDVFQDHLNYVSGSMQNRQHRALDRLLSGYENSELELVVKRVGHAKPIDILSLVRNQEMTSHLAGHSGYLQRENGYIDSNLYYFDLSRTPFDATLLNEVATNCENIIFDLRGYMVDSDSQNIVSNIAQQDISTSHIFIPEIIKPDSIRWVAQPEFYTSYNTALSRSNLFFLTSGTTQSAPETLLDLVKSFRIGTIVGEATSGANGNMNFLELPGEMLVTFSGYKVLNSDGTAHHNIGVQPDHPVEFTVQHITDREDPYITKVREIISERK